MMQPGSFSLALSYQFNDANKQRIEGDFVKLFKDESYHARICARDRIPFPIEINSK